MTTPSTPATIVAKGIDKYKKTEKLGEGTYGIVFKAIDTETNKTVALKKIRFDDDLDGIPSTAIREISLLKGLNHPNVVRLENVFFHTQNSQLYLAFEYLQNDLKKHVDSQKKRLSLQTVKSYVHQLLQGIEYCHKKRVLHRDLKPQNILIDEKRGVLKIADFGLARIYELPSKEYTREVITLWYRPPEILLGCESYSWEVDIWSVGCIFAELVLGFPLFLGDCQISQLYSIFRILGTPTENIWPGISKLKYYQNCFPKWQTLPLFKIIPKLDELGRNLLSMMLVFEPKQRISAKQALKHPYFSEVRS